MTYTAKLGNVTVTAEQRYIVHGSVRGLVSQHRTLGGAESSLKRDKAGCRAQGGYSDAQIYEYDGSQWVAQVEGGKQ